MRVKLHAVKPYTLWMIVASTVIGCERSSYVRLTPRIYFYQYGSIRQILIDRYTSQSMLNDVGEGGTVVFENVLNYRLSNNVVFGSFRESGNIKYFVIKVDPKTGGDSDLQVYTSEGDELKALKNAGVSR